MPAILVTGANGFVGSELVSRLTRDGRHLVVRGVRQLGAPLPRGAAQFVMGDFGQPRDWSAGLADVVTIVHTAARVHRMKDPHADPHAEYRRVNVEATLELARQAAIAGVRRFVFLSTAKVFGEASPSGRPFRADTICAPADPYSISKQEAEAGLVQIARTSGMEVVVLRPPLVYGPGARANFRQMARWVARGIPLPLAGIRNRRSLVSVQNLVDLIVVCIEHPRAANQSFMVSDGEDLSTPDLLRRLAVAMRRPARLFWAPPVIVRAAGALMGQSEGVRRLFETLQVDIEKTKLELGWQPPVPVSEGLEAAVRGMSGQASV